jgi:hypothetical protein
LLIDRDSKLAAITLPDRVTPKVLLALIEGLVDSSSKCNIS